MACDKFIYIEIIGNKEISTTETGAQTITKTTSTPAQTAEIDTIDNKFIKLLESTVEDIADDNGWAFLAEVGALIIKKKPDFDPRNYGFQKLTPLIKSLDEHFEIDEREVENKHIKHIYVKIKKSILS